MTKIISKLEIGKICLISFILLCSVFTSENAFSIWQRDYMKVKHNQNKNTITFDFIFYESSFLRNHDNYHTSCNFYYYENGKTTPNHFMSTYTLLQKDEEQPAIFINKEKGEIIKLLNSIKPTTGSILSDKVMGLKVVVNVTKEQRISTGHHTYTAKMSHLKVEFKFLNSDNIRSIRLRGCWEDDKYHTGRSEFDEVYELDNVKSNSNRLENIPSDLSSEIVNEVKVTGGTDAINVTGAEPGENIKVYTASGVEVKSVVAADDVVNIQLPTNQIYVVKAGRTRYKVAL